MFMQRVHLYYLLCPSNRNLMLIVSGVDSIKPFRCTVTLMLNVSGLCMRRDREGIRRRAALQIMMGRDAAWEADDD